LSGAEISPVHVVAEIPSGAHFGGVSVSKRAHPLGQLLLHRHQRPADQHRNDEDLALEGRQDLDANKIRRVVQPTLAALGSLRVANVEPLLPDDGQQDVALPNGLVEVFAEIDAERNGVDVQKNVVASEMRFQPVVDATRDMFAVVSAVGNEYLGHGGYVAGFADELVRGADIVAVTDTW
jgi:hypothetical protein